jgi:type I restriction enzyme M protein
MISNPPYGKSWKKDLEAMGGKKEMKDPRFQVSHQGEVLSLVTRSSDGQMLFLANMASKMNHDSPLGSRIAQVHNGSSLFTGDAGSGESNIRRWLFENDWVEAIVALPLNLFYNTGIATYVWLLSNRKTPERQGKVQLIDASAWFEPLRKNLGKKNCIMGPADIERVMAAYDAMEQSEHAKVFANEAFGYWKVSVERPLRLHSRITPAAIEALRTASGDREIREMLWGDYGDALLSRFASLKPELEQRLREWSSGDDLDGEDSDEEGQGEPSRKGGIPEKRRKKLLDPGTWQRDAQLAAAAEALRELFGEELFDDHNHFRSEVQNALKLQGLKLSTPDLKLLLKQVSWREESAPPVIAKVHKGGKVTADPLHGLFALELNGKLCVVEYEPDTDLRDSEQIPLLEEGGIEAFIRREVLPYTPDAWINQEATKVGYEVSFTRHFYKPRPLRNLAEIAADIRAIEAEAEGLLDGLLVGAG